MSSSNNKGKVPDKQSKRGKFVGEQRVGLHMCKTCSSRNESYLHIAVTTSF